MEEMNSDSGCSLNRGSKQVVLNTYKFTVINLVHHGKCGYTIHDQINVVD